MENTSEQDLSKDVGMKPIGDDLHSMEASNLRTSSGLTFGSTSMESPMNGRSKAIASWSFWFIFALTDSFNVLIFCLKHSPSPFASFLFSSVEFWLTEVFEWSRSLITDQCLRGLSHSILAPTEDSNPDGRVENHKRWPLHYHCIYESRSLLHQLTRQYWMTSEQLSSPRNKMSGNGM